MDPRFLSDYWDELEKPASKAAAPENPEAVTAQTPTSETPEAITANPPPAVPAMSKADSASSLEAESRIALSTSKLSAVPLFWITSLVLALGLICFLLLQNSGDLCFSLVVLVLVLPALQLAAVFFASLILTVCSRHDRYQFEKLGGIALGVFLGALIGLVPMVILVLLMMAK